MSRRPLTPVQQRLLDFIQDYWAQHHVSPTLAEICRHFDYSAHSTAQGHLHRLAEKRYITLHPYLHRNIEVIGLSGSLRSRSGIWEAIVSQFMRIFK